MRKGGSSRRAENLRASSREEAAKRGTDFWGGIGEQSKNVGAAWCSLRLGVRLIATSREQLTLIGMTCAAINRTELDGGSRPAWVR